MEERDMTGTRYSPIRYGILVALFTAMTLILTNQPANALPEILTGELHDKPYTLNVLESNGEQTVLEIRIEALLREKIVRDLNEYTRFGFGEWGYIQQVGKPQLPELSFIIAVPPRKGSRIEIRDSSWDEIQGYRIYPFQGQKTDCGDCDLPFQIDRALYEKDEWFPDEICYLTDPSIWRDLRVLSVKIDPVLYNPATGALRVCDYLRLAVYHEGLDLHNSLQENEIHVTPDYDALYRSLVVNYDFIEKGDARPFQVGYKYIVISHDSFADAPDLSDFIEMKSLKGVPARIEKLSSIGSDPTSIKNYITDTYSDGAEYILFIGDDEHIPVYDTWHGDHWYSCVDGADDYADIGLGRLSVKSTDDLSHQLAKIIQYEFAPPLNDWLHKSVLVAHREEAPNKYQGCKEDIRTYDYAITNPVFDTCYGAEGATNQDVKDAINNGRGIVNYRGHGGYTSWSSWNINSQSFQNSDVYSLQNGNMTPVVYNIACYNGGIDTGSDCLCEAWMKADDGAVGTLGATRPSYTTANHDFDRQLYIATFDLGYFNIMHTINHGKNYMIDHHGSYGLDNARMYLWLGDPELDIYTGIPETPSVSHPDIVFVGPATFPVNVTLQSSPVPNALVCLYKGEEIYTYKRTSQNGDASFEINPQTPGTLTVTVTGHDLLVYSVEVDVIVPDGPYVIYSRHLVDDDMEGTSWGNSDGNINSGETVELPLEVKNLGIERAHDVTGVISTADSYTTITDNFESFGTIDAGDSVFCTDDFDIRIADHCPDERKIHFDLTLQSSEDVWESKFSIVTKAAKIRCNKLWYDDSRFGNSDGIIDPGETVDLYVRIMNEGSATGIDIEGNLTFPPDDPYITIVQGSSGYPDLEPGENAMNETPYTIAVDPDTPESYYFDISASVIPRYGEGDEETFTLAVGTFEDDMEDGGEGWSHEPDQDGMDMWHLETARNHTQGGQWSYKCGGSGTKKYDPWTVCFLKTPVVRIPENARLRFWHWMNAEEYNETFAYDGGLLEISTDGTTWSQLTTTGGYTHLIGHRLLWNNPFQAYTPVWSGAFGWKKETVDLSEWTGQDVYFRFYFGSDDFALWGNLEGWYIDDVKIEIEGSGSILLTLSPETTELHRGDTLKVHARLQNSTQNTEWVKAYSEVFLKNGPPIPDNPVAGPFTLVLGPGADLTRIVTHDIPGDARLGSYTYRGTVREFEGEVLDTDEFDFEIAE
jgi:hypothetical protein